MNTFRYKRIFQIIVICVGFSICVSLQAFAQTASFQPVQKKLIEAGWDIPDTATLRKNLTQMENAPFDGVVLYAIGKDATGNTINVQSTFSNVPWKKEWFQSSVDDLKAIHSKKLTDNFLQVGANPGNVDLFDDAGWMQIADHLRIAAWIAKEGNLKGLLLDPEAYTKPYRQFEYLSQAQRDKHSFEEYQAKARQRGKEMISAVTSIDPNLMIYTYFMNSVSTEEAKSTNPQMALQSLNNGYDLYPAFINGWLDAAPPSMTFVEGSESQGFHANSQLGFLYAANLMRNTALNLVAPENRQKYLAQVQTSFGIYLDAYLNPPTSSYYIDPKGSTPTQRLQTNVQYAVDAANEYVWIYGEKYRWWPTESTSVSPQSWEDVLPGIHDALLGVTHPQLVIQQKIADLQKNGKLVNLLKNGDFSAAEHSSAPARNTSQDWKTVGAPSGWSTWQTDDSHGTFSQDNSVNHSNKQGGAARVAGTNIGCFIQSVDVKPGDSYIVQSWLRQSGQGNGWIRVRWQNADNKWTQQASDVLLFSADGSDKNAWQKIEGLVTVPEGAEKMLILLSAANQPSPQDALWFDDVQVYSLR